MPEVTLTVDDVVDAFCQMLEPGIRKNVLPREDCNKYGVDVLRRKSDPYQIMYHFITLDGLEVNLIMDLKELEKRGREYLDHLYGLLCDQTEQARKVRQDDNKITIYNTGSKVQKDAKSAEPPKLKPLVSAHNEVIH